MRKFYSREEIDSKPRKPYKNFADELIHNPGKYTEWPWPLGGDPKSNVASNLQYRIKTGVLSAFRPAGEFDAFVREGILYVAYVGKAEEDDENHTD